MHIKLFITFLFIFLNGFIIYSQEISGISVPYIQHFDDEDYHFPENQTWAVLKDDRGMLYFGNNSGVLEYDGTNWTLIEVANKSVVRSLAKDKNGRIYVGADNEIGYLESDSNSVLKYKTLTHLISEPNRNFEDVWQTLVIDDFIMCRSSSCVMQFKENKCKVFLPDNRFHLSFYQNNKFYVRERGKGLLVLEDDSLKLVPNSQIFANKRIYVMLPYGDGKFILVTREKGIYIYTPGQNHRFEKLAKFNRLDDFIIKNQIYCGITFKRDQYILGTLQDGFIIINEDGEILKHINTSSGLNNNTIYYLYLNGDDNLWIGTANGISYYPLSSQFQTLDSRNGLLGSVYYTTKFKNRIYTGNSLGVFYEFEPNKFRMVKNSKGQSWTLKEINNELYCANFEGLLKIKNGIAQNIEPVGNLWKIEELKFKEDYYLGGLDVGLAIFKLENNSLVYKHKINGYNETARYFHEGDSGKIWIGNPNIGLTLLRLDSSLMRFESTEFYNKENGLPESTNNYIFEVKIPNNENDFVIGTENGVYTFDNKLNTFIPNESLNRHLTNDGYIQIFTQDNNGNIYFEQGKSKGILELQPDNSYKLIRTSLLKIEDVYIENISIIDSNKILFGNKDGLVIYNPYEKPSFDKDFKILIRKVFAKDSLIYGGADEWEKENLISFDYNNLKFNYSALFYEENKKTEYSFYLDGFDSFNKWSSWSHTSEKEYTNLPVGIYSFKVKARNLYQLESNMAEFNFEILPPWYRTIFAYLIYIMICVLVIILIVKIYTRKLKQDKIKLEAVVKKRTHEVLQQNFEILQQKEEIRSQAENLTVLNKELEKLSIVAKETDNGVIITDSEGYFEWVNEGLIRLIGYTYEEILKVKGNNIFDSSSNPNIKEIYQSIKKTKKPKTYQASDFTKSGEKIWLQTTLTPILNKENEIVKLVAIDSNITAQKLAEDEIRRKNLDITDSIKYAKRIQDAMAPSFDELRTNVEDSFFIHLPKDIVSGDFFWFSSIEEKILIAVADCTGHGVPGAFMSLIGMSFLNKIVNEKKILNPNEILNRLQYNIITSLHKTGLEKDATDGMDISLIAIDKKTKKIEYSGAMNPIFIVREKEIIEFVADKIPIGLYEVKNEKYTIQEFDYKKGDQVYMFTDGYADQFGGKTNRKFLFHNFKKLMLSSKSDRMNEQRELILDKHYNWKGNSEQVDDILILGLKL
jgi:PAS domain S-box-containing protein